MKSIRRQILDNSVALVSLTVALMALGYNTWRNETTEAQRNVRHASFRVLESLGALQQVVDYRYYYLPFEGGDGVEGELRVRGFGHVAMVRDLMMLMPAPAPAAGEALQSAWIDGFNALDDLETAERHTAAAIRAERELTERIDGARAAVLEVLAGLD
jgi:hypothetical protein